MIRLSEEVQELTMTCVRGVPTWPGWLQGPWLHTSQCPTRGSSEPKKYVFWTTLAYHLLVYTFRRQQAPPQLQRAALCTPAQLQEAR